MVERLICERMYWRQRARPWRTICGLTCVGVARHQPMVAERRRETAAAAALDTIVLKRRFVRSSADSDRAGELRRKPVRDNLRQLYICNY